MTAYCFQEQVEFFTTVFQSPLLPIQPSIIAIFKITLKYNNRHGPSHIKNTYMQLQIFLVYICISFSWGPSPKHHL